MTILVIIRGPREKAEASCKERSIPFEFAWQSSGFNEIIGYVPDDYQRTLIRWYVESDKSDLLWYRVGNAEPWGVKL